MLERETQKEGRRRGRDREGGSGDKNRQWIHETS